MIAQEDRLPLTRQCQLLSLNRSTVYYQHAPVSDEELTWMRRIDEMHLKRPFYGSRRIRDWLQDEGHAVNRKRIQRLMRLMGIAALYPKPRTSKRMKHCCTDTGRGPRGGGACRLFLSPGA
ncbi:MAG: IS3 family transposase [Candidatus Thiodiazotropha sp. (ex Epidulcina cf. delphinae)]|nr:IS3 family transposase [Candidatus Thiodiazotropha sp. (ex Epidulcina cf. delphinae)]